MKKTFEIQKTINHSIGEIGVLEEITESEYNAICSKLFLDFKGDTPFKIETESLESSDIIKSNKIREFLFDVFKFDFLYSKNDRSNMDFPNLDLCFPECFFFQTLHAFFENK